MFGGVLNTPLHRNLVFWKIERKNTMPNILENVKSLGCRITQKGIGKFFMSIRTILWPLLLFWKFHYIKSETTLKRLQESFKVEIGELQFGIPAAAHWWSRKFVNWTSHGFPICYWADILKTVGHFIFS